MRRVLLGMLAFLVAFGVFAGIQAACSTRVLPFDPASYVPEQFSEAVYAIPETDFERYDWTLYAPDELVAAETAGVTLPQGTAPAEWADEGAPGRSPSTTARGSPGTALTVSRRASC